MSTDPAEALATDEALTRERLAGLRREHEQIVDSADGATDDEHDPEGTTAYDRARTAALIEAASTHLAEIAAARARLETGAYGTCEVCGKPIPAERLEARPTARTCVGCPAR
ncbi:TraR/DksA C4-type zinc finger protein [Sporichthya sp.]|uniref:TraR/DksA family transcriptional regulator n=1 Tax=Sporichthya sp. TaxID=65475 RepID=UPI0025E7067A|nr:TraR/DksA C4-type zinc finger protein [Sporichthya sp.]